MTEDRLMSAAEAAKELGVSKRRVLAMIDADNPARKLPAVKIGTQWVIRASDLAPFRTRKGGRPAHTDPSPAALAKRRSRERRKG